MGNKIVLKNFEREPVVVETETSIEIKQGDPCKDEGTPTDPSEPTDPSPSAASRALAFGIPLAMGQIFGLPTTAMALTAGVAAFGLGAQAQNTAECSSVPIEVDIYVDATVEEIVNKMYKAGEYNECPAESKSISLVVKGIPGADLSHACFLPIAQYWEHQDEVFSGFTGCVAERGLYPCASDATDITREDGAFYDSLSVVWDPENDVCVETGNTIEDALFIIRGGNPMDKHELVKRTGVSRFVMLPLVVCIGFAVIPSHAKILLLVSSRPRLWFSPLPVDPTRRTVKVLTSQTIPRVTTTMLASPSRRYSSTLKPGP